MYGLNQTNQYENNLKRYSYTNWFTSSSISVCLYLYVYICMFISVCLYLYVYICMFRRDLVLCQKVTD